LGSDSHTPTTGGLGMIAIGAGGLDVAVAMGGGLFYLNTPKVLGVKLTGKLHPLVTAKDVILEILRRLTVKGGVGKIIEYYGEGVKTLSVPERATITNMGAELGATTSVFPSDETTKKFLESQGRAKDWTMLSASENAEYDETIELDLSSLTPLIAQPHSPDNVVKVKDIEGLKVDQVCIGSCTNSSFKDLMVAAKMLEGRKIHPEVSMTLSPGSRQIFEELSRNGALASFISAGVRVMESACGPCIGMGQSPPSGGVSIRTFNRNFEGRSGTKDAKVYLSSVEVAVASALAGVVKDPQKFGAYPSVKMPSKFAIDDSLIIKSNSTPDKVEVIRGPNIKPLPKKEPLPEKISGVVLLKVGDNITTDHIMPAGSKILPLRSNIPAISEHVFEQVDSEFPKRAREAGGGLIVGGANYGQGSSREHAAIAPMHLGVKAVLAKSFARIHKANLINFGIMPFEFADEKDYDSITQGDVIELTNLTEQLKSNAITAFNKTKGMEIKLKHDYTVRQIKIIRLGGLLNYTRSLNR
ncbi:MAG: aconitate hydratase, partial [Candidatus Altiarchaeota archaeon]|nr:aconitate hydratase [Candidatus Altiarchaeota archaeon]